MKRAPVRSTRSRSRPRRDAVDLGILNTVWKLGGRAYLPLRLILVAKLIDRYIEELLGEKAQLSIPEWRVVAQLAMLKHGSVRKMARQACVDPAEVSRSAATLARRGLVQRRENPQDRRSPQFSLTAEGEAHYAKFHPYWTKFTATLVSELDEADRNAMEHGLERIARELLHLLGEEVGQSVQADSRPVRSNSLRRPGSTGLVK
jgi:DNA-binding MarR family transcriptional regulator